MDVTLSGFNILSTYDTISHSLDTARHMNKYSRYMYTTTSLVAVVERLVCRCREVGLLSLKCLLWHINAIKICVNTAETNSSKNKKGQEHKRVKWSAYTPVCFTFRCSWHFRRNLVAAAIEQYKVVLKGG